MEGKLSKKEDIPEDLIDSLSHEELKKAFGVFVKNLKQKYNIRDKQIAELFVKDGKNSLPISIFNNDELSCLESIVKYLKEDFGLKYHEIALLLNRDDRTIWTTYNIALKKRKARLQVIDSNISIPVSNFTNRKFSVLESIVSYLKEKFNLRFSQIAELLNRDERNIWTVYNRYKKKK